jgi:hypothetical protein
VAAALDESDHAPDDTARIKALARVPDLYQGQVATDASYDWLEPARQAIRRKASTRSASSAASAAPTIPSAP